MPRLVPLLLLSALLTPRLMADEVADLKTLVATQQAQIRQQSQMIETQGKQLQQLLNAVGTAGTDLKLTGAVNFGTQTRQMLNLWSTEYAIGVQAWTQYFRSHGNFAFYRDGVHSDTMLDPGAGGEALMTIDASGVVKAKSFQQNGANVLTSVSCKLYKRTITRPDELDRCPSFGGALINNTCYQVSCY